MTYIPNRLQYLVAPSLQSNNGNVRREKELALCIIFSNYRFVFATTTGFLLMSL